MITLNLKRIEAERVAIGFNQQQMAEKLGFKSKVSYSQRELGKVNFSAIELANFTLICGYNLNQMSLFYKEID